MVSSHFRDSEAPTEFSDAERINLGLGLSFFWWFLDNIFVRSYDGQTFYSPGPKRRVPFQFSDVHREWAVLAQYNPRLCLQAARMHLKTTVLGQAYPFWFMASAKSGSFVDGVYFSYKAELATEKLTELKRLIKMNPYCRFWRDLKPSADSIINYLIDWGDGPIAEVYLRGSGIRSATRGRHPKFTICDDILSDFANPLASSEMRLISRIFRNSIMSLPANPEDPLILIGTPQSYDDILYQLAENEEWMWLTYPAVQNWAGEKVLWPEKYDFDRLMRIRKSIKKEAFAVEYQLVPVTVTDQFFTAEDLAPIVSAEIQLWDLTKEFPNPHHLGVYAGLDIGKLVHPSHVAVFWELPDKTLVPLYQSFLDHMTYPRQVRLLNLLADRFNLRGYYDLTNNVLEDRGLSRKWRGFKFTKQLKANIATLLEKRVFAESDEPGILLLDDDRYLGQIVAVRKDLTAPTTVDGHGDPFWSTGLAVLAAEDGPPLTDIGNAAARPTAKAPLEGTPIESEIFDDE